MKKHLLLLSILIVMVVTISFSQEVPEKDIIKTSGGDLEMLFIGHGTLMFDFNGTIIHIDPVSMYTDYQNMPKADMILVSHEHGDHFDIDALNAIRKEGSVFYTTETVAGSVSLAIKVEAGNVVDYKESFTVEMIPAYNIVNMRSEGNPYHPRGNGIGFLFTFGDTRVYVAGDTENTPEMKALKDIDIAFLPMNLPYTMTPEMVADAALAFKPSILYPYHFGDTDTNKLVELLEDTEVEVRIRALE